jgi:hypothetical protein
MTLAIAVAICLAAPADAAPASSAAVEVARTVLSPEQHKAMIAAVRAQIAAQMGAASETDQKEIADLLDKAMPSYQEMIDFQSGLLAKYYTADELDQLAKFYGSPVGKKTIKIMPDLMRDVMGYSQERLMRELPKFIQSRREKAKAMQK